MMHTYRKLDDDRFVVGYWNAISGSWTTIKEFKYEGRAAAYASYLNGGEPPYQVT
jgi:hypothetical protein